MIHPWNDLEPGRAGMDAVDDRDEPLMIGFIGDEITADWASAFAANPNWINKGQSSEPIEGLQTAASVLARFQSDGRSDDQRPREALAWAVDNHIWGCSKCPLTGTRALSSSGDCAAFRSLR